MTCFVRAELCCLFQHIFGVQALNRRGGCSLCMLASNDASIIACHKGKVMVLQRFHSFTFAGRCGGFSKTSCKGGKWEGGIWTKFLSTEKNLEEVEES